jgi:serine/threonine protein phosphatase PrpC
LKEVLKVADNAIATKGIVEYKCTMGTTIALAIISDYQMFYTWQGNVRIYLKNDNGLSILTSDHILDVGYGQTRVTRCIKGIGLREDIPVKVIKLTRNDNVFFCTDGFYNIAESMLSNKSITEIKDAIIKPDDDVSLIQVNV